MGKIWSGILYWNWSLGSISVSNSFDMGFHSALPHSINISKNSVLHSVQSYVLKYETYSSTHHHIMVYKLRSAICCQSNQEHFVEPPSRSNESVLFKDTSVTTVLSPTLCWSETQKPNFIKLLCRNYCLANFYAKQKMGHAPVYNNWLLTSFC